MRLHAASAAVLALLAALLGAAAPAPAALATSGGRCTCEEVTTDCSRRHKSVLRPADLCPNTTVIDMQGNNVSEFPDGLQAFRVILAAENRLSRLPRAEQLGPLVRLMDLSRNAMANSSRELNAQAHLRILRVQHNFLSSLDFLPRPACSLYVLDAANNSLSSLEGPLQDCTGLVFLNLGQNQLATVPDEALSKLRNLKDLFLDSNMIESISERAFKGLKSLRKLSLSRNLLTSLPEGALRGCSELLELDLSGNGLSALPAGLLHAAPRLESLDLHANQLLALPARLLASQSALRQLQVWKNRLTELPDLSECCPSLEVANFDSNNLTETSQEAQRSLLDKLQRRQPK